MNALPSGWAKTSVSDVSEAVTKGTTPTTLGFAYQASGVLFVKAESLTDMLIDRAKCAFIDELAHDALRRSSLAKSDILFTIAGTLGRVAIVSNSNLPANTNQAVAIIRLIEPMIAPYTARFLRSEASSVDAPKSARRFFEGCEHVVGCCHLSGLWCSDGAAGPYGSSLTETKSDFRTRSALTLTGSSGPVSPTVVPYSPSIDYASDELRPAKLLRHGCDRSSVNILLGE